MVKKTRKFGKKRYTLKWDSVTFNTYHNPDSKAGIAEKKRIAEMWAGDYDDINWQSKITTYRGGKEFKVWALPR